MATIGGFWFMSNNLSGTDDNDDMFGMGFADILHGNGGSDTMHGGGGNDQIFGEDGNDKLFGDEGDDKLFGDANNDTLDGGKGDDRLYGGADQDRFIDTHGNNHIDGGTGFDTLDYSGFTGGRVRVTMADSGREGLAIREDFISQGTGGHFERDGSDSFVAIEKVIGTSGADVIIGNNTGNILRGGAGLDTVTGGGGSDVFLFDDGDLSTFAFDRVTDFDTQDALDFRDMDARTDVAGNNEFHFVSNFTGASGELVLRNVGNGDFNLFADTNGDGSSDFILLIHETTAGALTTSDFLL
ncbi:calcium-binding protein [Bradyrhizobium sp. LjRoot220]|uniref:calcium-binding protein n=1 Tax=Bradyrhizobium sp. LjRoot220 TaxID=3342284 RepID=UPI003ECD662C